MRPSSLFTRVNVILSMTVLLMISCRALGNTDFWAPADPPRAHYTIDCHIDPQKRKLEGYGIIRLKNTARWPISRLVLYQQAKKGGSLKISVDGKAAAVIQELNYRSNAHNSPFEDYRYTIFDLPQPLHPGKSIDLRVEFATSVAENSMLFLTDWHPRLYWGYPTHDDFKVKVNAPQEYSLVTSGLLDTKFGFYHGKDIRSFGIVLGKDQKVMSATAGSVLIQLLCPNGLEEWAQTVLPTAVDAIDFYTKRFGFYPYKNLSIVAAGNYNVATSIAGIHYQVFDKKEDTLNDLKWSTAHEIAHMYWGEYVLNKEIPTDLRLCSDPLRWEISPMMLGLGFRADREYTRAKGLAMVSYDDFYKNNFNWLTRAFNDGQDTTMSMTTEQQLEFTELYQNKVLRHGRGYALVSALENLIGSDAFDLVYRRCMKTYGGKRMDTHDLQAECEKETGQELTWFFDKWMRTNTYPAFEIVSKECSGQGNSYLTEVKVKSVGTLKTPVVVEALFSDGSKQVGRTDRLLDASTLHFESSAPLKDIRLDPNGELPLMNPPYPPSKTAVIDQISNWLQTTWTRDQTNQLITDAAKLKIQGQEHWLNLALGAYKGGWYQESLTAIEQTEQLGTVFQSQYAPVGVFGMKGLLLDLFGQREKAVECYKTALEAYRQSNRILNCTPLGLRFDQKWLEERLTTPFKRAENPK